jgi:hypothetical protein
MSEGLFRNLARFLVIWWAVGALIVSFGGPFQTTGNGYFGSYLALVASIGVLQTSMENETE